ncbi:A24 family peptidase [Amycolatopsis sp. NBC_00345]|uniref:A24 family peptidase n=1 Tax=Amycolatopsis sp. NBC_00345 TaxID=2975955 RepID=UPI002E26375E
MEWGLFLLVVAAGTLASTGAGLLVRGAAAPISLRLAAVVAGAGAAIVAWRWQAGGWPGWWLPVTWLVTVLGVPLALADLRHRRLPDVLTLPAYPLLAAGLAGGGLETLTAALTGVLLFGGAHLLVRHFAPGQLGAGDVKLTGILGAVLGAVGWPALAFAAVAASVLSAALAAAGHIHAVTRRPPENPAPKPKPGAGPAHRTTHPPASAVSAAAADESLSTPVPHRTTHPHASVISAAAAEDPPPASAPSCHPTGVPHHRAAQPRTPGRSHRSPRVPHGPALLLATWLCAVFAGPGSGVATS